MAVFYLSAVTLNVLLLLLDLTEAQCPDGSNTIFDNRDRMVNVPLTVPLCIGCRFLDGMGERINLNDSVWEKDPSDGGPDVTLNNGSYNGNVTILYSSSTRTSILILAPYPEAVVNFGDVLRCSSETAAPINDHNGRIIFTLLVFTFLNPIVSPNGTVDVIEGSNVTLTCSDPGNSGTTRYQWINGSNGNETGDPSNGPTLTLLLNNVQRSLSGVYICRSTNNDLPQEPLETGVIINVQYPPDITFISSGDTLVNGSSIIINCTFDANPFVHSVIWIYNGSLLDANGYSHIDINTQSTYSELIFSSFQVDDSGDYVCNVTNSIGYRESSVVQLIVQVYPDPVSNLMAPISDITNSSVRLVWSLGFNGNARLTGGSVTYTATDNGVGNGVQPFTGETVTEQEISSLEPFTTYSFSVVVTNAVGNSEQRTVSATTLPLVPTAPTLNSVTSINSTALFVSWTDNRDSRTQSVVDKYTVVVYFIEGSRQANQTVIVTAPSTSVTIAGLAEGTSYTVRLTATNSAGVSADSNSITRQTDIDRQECETGDCSTLSLYLQHCCQVSNLGETIEMMRENECKRTISCPFIRPRSCPPILTRKDCKDWYEAGSNTSGIYTIDPDDGQTLFDVYCDMETDGGGWTVFQRRQDGSVDFFRNWVDYMEGFGSLTGEFWLGLDKIHRLTHQGESNHSLRVDLGDFENDTAYALYSTFSIGDNSTEYTLNVAGYFNGSTAGDGLITDGSPSHNHNGIRFSTRDNDNGNCAEYWRGAWWFNGCFQSHLNGPYSQTPAIPFASGIIWVDWKGYRYSLKFTEMKTRRN